MRKVKLLMFTLFTLFLISCQPEKPRTLPQIIQQENLVKEKSGESEAKIQESKKEKKIEDVPVLKYQIEKPKKELPKKEPIDPKTIVKTTQPVIVSVEGMPLSDFVQYVLGDVLKAPYFIDEQVKNMKNPITLRMTDPMDPDKLLNVIIDLLEKNGVEVSQRAGVLYLSKPSQQTKPVDIVIGDQTPDTFESIVQIVPLKFSSVSDIEFLIKNLYPSVSFQSYPKENALIFRGSGSSIKEAISLIKIFDVPFLQDKKVRLVNLLYWQPDEFINQIKTILEGLGIKISKNYKEAGISFIPIKFANSVLIVAPDEESLNYVLNWYEKLDTPESAGSEEKSFVYKPKYSRATDLVNSIQKIYGVISTPTPTTTLPTATTPTTTTTQSQPTQQVINTPKIRIVADDQTNTILINAKPSDYRNLLVYLENLDIPPKQVLLETTIAEVTLKDDLQYGVEWFLKNRMNQGDYSISTLGQLGLPGVGLTFRFISDTQRVNAVLNLLAKNNLINIVSTPRLMVLNNKEATIQIGTEVPVITGEIATPSANTATPNVTRSVQYRTTGTILRVKPTINTEETIILDVNQEISDAQQNTTSGIDSPIILTRRISTSVVVKNGQTLVLGGIISENKSSAETKVPFFGDIPILGTLFKNKAVGKTKTELLIIITPLIINNFQEAKIITDEIKKDFKGRF
jgi:general secretion pathway protein D